MKQKVTIKKEPDPIKSAKTSLSRLKMLLLTGSIVVITFFSFSPALKNNFINWDDHTYVVGNHNLSKPLPQAIKYFFEPHYFMGNYIPVTMIVYALEYRIADLDPQFYHTVNILIHILNVLLVFWFIYLLSGKKPEVAALVSLFFGIHPMHVESVVWIAELKDVLYSFFFLSGLIAYYKYIEKKDEKSFANPGMHLKTGEQSLSKKKMFFHFPVISLIFFSLSLLSKPAAVTFPVVLLLLDFYTRRKYYKWILAEKIPFFIVSIIFGIIAIRSQQADRLIHDYYPFSQRLLFASHSFLSYIANLFLPFNLSIYYPYPPQAGGHLPYLFYIAPAVVVLLFYGIYRTLKYTRLIAFGTLFYFVNILLVLQLMSVGDAVMADRYTYIPYIGLFFIITMGFDRLYHSNRQKLKAYKPVSITIIIAFAVTCSYLTYARCEVWENDETIATDLLNKFPEDRIALNTEGFLLYKQGKYEDAIRLFTKAIEVKPDYVKAYINLVNTYLALKDYDDALKITDDALKHAPQDYSILNTKGYLLYQQQKYPEAIKYYNDAIQMKKDNITGYLYLAQCYYLLQEYNDQIKMLDIALKYDPDNYISLNDKGYTLYIMGKYSEALEYYKASLKIKPDYAIASANLSNCSHVMNDSSKAKK